MVELYLDVACRNDFSSWVSANGLAASDWEELAAIELEEKVSSEVSFLTSFSQEIDVNSSNEAKMSVPEIEISFMIQVFR